jgi:anti-sigma regulatory factor (Ser/Thr protein kinase)
MRAHTFLVGDGVDFTESDNLLSRLLHDAGWTGTDEIGRARLGLHELLVNIRNHAYGGEPGAIDVGMTATGTGLTITVTDWGRRLGQVDAPELPHLSEGGYGLTIIDGCFDDVTYRRRIAHNKWTLCLHREVSG